MQLTEPGIRNRYFYYMVDADDLHVIGYYDLLGQKTTLHRCWSFLRAGENTTPK